MTVILEKDTPYYIGDGVYVEFDGYHVVVKVNDHRNEPAVLLEPEVMEELIKFYQRVKLK